MPIPNPYQYQYQPTDDPVGVASQFGVTPQQLLGANPGGSPFTTGQNINIPFQYGTPNPAGAQANAVATNFDQRGRGFAAPPSVGQYTGGIISTANANNSTFRGRGINSFYDTAANSRYGTDDYGFARADGSDGRDTRTTPAGTATTPGTPNTAGGDFYGYERDPETGRAVRVIKNSSSANFLNEMRWDPQRRRYVSIGRLLKQGKLDLKGNWHNSSKRQKRSAAAERKNKQQTQQQDFTLSNSLISFGASSG